ncbi:MAG: hypothetical protein OXC08_16375 [Thiotrichales bacterium]|nr:hypothetical protein [Thiotrichales bacterium]
MLWGNRRFTAERPRMSARLLPDDAAQIARDCWLDRGHPRPAPQLRRVEPAVLFPPGVQTIWRFDENRWFAWALDVDVVRAPVVEDTTNRTIWTGDDYPRHTSTAIMQGGGFVSPGIPVSRRLGVPVPEDAPTIEGGELDEDETTSLVAETHSWIYTFLTDLEEEGPPSPPSDDIERRLAHMVEEPEGAYTKRAAIDGLDDEAGLVAGDVALDGEGGKLYIVPAAPDTRATLKELLIYGRTLRIEVDDENHIQIFVAARADRSVGDLEVLEIRGVLATTGTVDDDASVTLKAILPGDANIQPVTITMPSAAPASWGANAGITHKRIYRTATGASDVTTWFLLATVPIAQAEYTDEKQTKDLGDELVSTHWDPPPADLSGLIALPNGVLAGFVGRDVYFSEPYQPHAWPRDYVETVEDDVVGLANFGTNVVIGTTGAPQLRSGADPARSSPSRLEFSQPCAAKRSFGIVDQQGIVYASPEGLVLVGPAGGKFISRAYYDKADWATLRPVEFRAVYHDGAYVAFSTTRSVAIADDIEGAVEFTDAGVRAVFQDTARDTIYVVGADRYLYEWATGLADGDAPRTMRWRSRLHVAQARTFSAAQVIASAYPVTFKLFGDGVERATKAVASRRAFRLPDRMGLRTEWEYEIAGTSAVQEVRIGAMSDMQD